MNRVLRNHGLKEYPESNYRQFIGGGLYDLVKMSAGDNCRSGEDKEFLYTLAEEFRILYEKNAVVHTTLYPGITGLLARLEELEIKKAILSNKLHSIVLHMVQKLLYRWNFESVWGVKDGYPKKPDPTCALEIAKELDLLQRRIYCIGDSGSDMITARRAGMIPVGVLWGFRDKEELIKAGAEHILNQPGDLLKILRREHEID
jgi:phosphoglycolate phosphatase